MTTKTESMPMMEKVEQKPEVRVNIPQGSQKKYTDFQGLKLGQTVSFEIKGKVKSCSYDDYGSNVCIELTEGGLENMKEDLKELKDSRRL